MGAEWFESQLVDYDVCPITGTESCAAGIGNDPREDRYFNIMRRECTTPRARGVRHWLPGTSHRSGYAYSSTA